MAVGNLRRVGVINGTLCGVGGVCLEGEAGAETSFDVERNTPGLEGDERKADIFEGEGKMGRLVGEIDAVLLVWESKSLRGEGWRWGV